LTIFLSLVTLLWDFMVTNFIPATAADVTLIHFFIWGGVVIGLLGAVWSMIRRAAASSRR
jgi:hypothetical protein